MQIFLYPLSEFSCNILHKLSEKFYSLLWVCVARLDTFTLECVYGRGLPQGAVRLAMKEPPLICYHYYAAKNQVVPFFHGAYYYWEGNRSSGKQLMKPGGSWLFQIPPMFPYPEPDKPTVSWKINISSMIPSMFRSTKLPLSLKFSPPKYYTYFSSYSYLTHAQPVSFFLSWSL